MTDTVSVVFEINILHKHKLCDIVDASTLDVLDWRLHSIICSCFVHWCLKAMTHTMQCEIVAISQQFHIALS